MAPWDVREVFVFMNLRMQHLLDVNRKELLAPVQCHVCSPLHGSFVGKIEGIRKDVLVVDVPHDGVGLPDTAAISIHPIRDFAMGVGRFDIAVADWVHFMNNKRSPSLQQEELYGNSIWRQRVQGEL